MLKALKNRLNNRKGFTLIELIVVIAIIAILAAVLIPRFTGFSDEARKKSVLSDTRNILMALEALDASGQFPTTGAQAKINEYVGKDIVTDATAPATPADGDSWLSVAPTSVTGGITFTYNKRISGKTYTCVVTASAIGNVS